MKWQSLEEEKSLALEKVARDACNANITIEEIFPIILRCATSKGTEYLYKNLAGCAISADNKKVYQFIVRVVKSELKDTSTPYIISQSMELWIQAAYAGNYSKALTWLNILKEEKLPIFYAGSSRDVWPLYSAVFYSDNKPTYLPLFDWITKQLHQIKCKNRPNHYWSKSNYFKYLFTPTKDEYFDYLKLNFKTLAHTPRLLKRSLLTFKELGAAAALSSVIKAQNSESLNVILSHLPAASWGEKELECVKSNLVVSEANPAFLIKVLRLGVNLKWEDQIIDTAVCNSLPEAYLIKLFKYNKCKYLKPEYFQHVKLLNMPKLRKAFRCKIEAKYLEIAVKYHCSGGAELEDLESFDDIMPRNQAVLNLMTYFRGRSTLTEEDIKELKVLVRWHKLSRFTAAAWKVWTKSPEVVNQAIGELRSLGIPIPSIANIEKFHAKHHAIPESTVEIITEHHNLKKVNQNQPTAHITSEIALG